MISDATLQSMHDPIRFGRWLWPEVDFYAEQRKVLRSVVEDDETYVPAGNMMGKDFVAGFIVPWFFLTRTPCRIITTSAKDDHLRVLWGEINRFIRTAAFPLDWKSGGPLVINHHELRKVIGGKREPMSYVKGMVASQDSIASLGGHHASNPRDPRPHTLLVIDEASSVDDEYIKICRPWAKRILVIGNTWPCENFFKHAIEGKPGTEDRGGDISRASGVGYHRRVIRIQATDSPNVRLALREQAMGREPSGRIVLAGVKDWAEYQKNLATWDEPQQCVSLRAEFYKGATVLLYPREWLQLAGAMDRWSLCNSYPTEAIGIDPGEGGANTAMAAVNRYGLKELVSKKTPNTAVIVTEAIAFGQRHGVPASKWIFDRGGGGKQHVDTLRQMGYPARTVAFGEGITLDLRRGTNPLEVRKDAREDHYAYMNRRAEMYGELRTLLDPSLGPSSFSALSGSNSFSLPDLPGPYAELRRQLSPIPLTYDGEGRLILPPKNRPPAQASKGKTTLVDLIGCSPDEADALVLAVHGMLHKAAKSRAGVPT